jgi:hypothetical protein
MIGSFTKQPNLLSHKSLLMGIRRGWKIMGYKQDVHHRDLLKIIDTVSLRYDYSA